MTANEGEPGSQHGAQPGVPAGEEAAATVPPRKPRTMWWLLLVALVGVATFAVTRSVAYDDGVQDERARVAARASASAAVLPPADLYCPDADSDEIKTKAVRDKPVVTITEPPAERVLVMRKAVVVVIKVEVTVDIVICGNDAALVLEKPLRASARVLMQGGTDSESKTAGPMVFVVDDVAEPDANRVWFSNRKPQVVRCTVATVKPGVRPCTSYYSAASAASTSPATVRPSATR